MIEKNKKGFKTLLLDGHCIPTGCRNRGPCMDSGAFVNGADGREDVTTTFFNGADGKDGWCVSEFDGF